MLRVFFRFNIEGGDQSNYREGAVRLIMNGVVRNKNVIIRK